MQSYAERCSSYSKYVCLSVCLTVCHTLALCQNDSRYTIMRSSLEDIQDSPMTLSFLAVNLTAKFQREHREGRRRMREG